MKLIIFILIIYLSIFIFDRLTSNYKNHYPFILVFGKKGSGKTTLLTKIAIQNIRKGRKVYSNVAIPGTYFYNPEDIGKITFDPESVVLCDEISILFHSRNFKSFDQEKIEWFKLQRHYKVTFFACSQSWEDYDKVLRILTDEIWLSKSFLRVFTIRRRIIKRIIVGTAGEDQSGDARGGIMEDYKFDSILFGGLKFTFIPRYVPFFNSFTTNETLPVITGEYYPMTEEQNIMLSTKAFCKKTISDKLKTLIGLIIGSVKGLKHLGRRPKRRIPGAKGTNVIDLPVTEVTEDDPLNNFEGL